jgi:hypothetical protein
MYDLSFSNEFFYGTEEFEHLQTSQKPTSVLQALISLAPEELTKIAEYVIGKKVKNFHDIYWQDMLWKIIDKIKETNTCDTLTPPVGVYVDPEGDFVVKVWDDR